MSTPGGASISTKVQESNETSNAQWTGANKLLANNWNVGEGGLDGFVHADCNSITWLAGMIWRRRNP